LQTNIIYTYTEIFRDFRFVDVQLILDVLSDLGSETMIVRTYISLTTGDLEVFMIKKVIFLRNEIN
ncbi:MAG: hypothetical protein EA412_14555, partial [Chitinophagaceae bacterium]